MKYILCVEDKKNFADYKRISEKNNNVLVFKEKSESLHDYISSSSIIMIPIDNNGNVKDISYTFLEKDVKDTINKNYGIVNTSCSFYIEISKNKNDAKFIAIVCGSNKNMEYWALLSVKNLINKSNKKGITNINTIIVPYYFCMNIYKNLGDAMKSSHNNDCCEGESEIYYVFSEDEIISDTDSEYIID